MKAVFALSGRRILGLNLRQSLTTTAVCALGMALLVAGCGKARILEGLVAVLDNSGAEIRMQMADVHLLPGKSRETITTLLAQHTRDIDMEISRQVEIRRISLLPQLDEEIAALDKKIAEKNAEQAVLRTETEQAEAEKKRISSLNAAAISKATTERDRILAERDALMEEISKIEASHSEEVLSRRQKALQEKTRLELDILSLQQDIYNLEHDMNQAISLIEARKIRDTVRPDKAIEEARAKIEEARKDLETVRSEKAEEFSRMYASRMMAVSGNVDDTLSGLGITRTCFRIHNKGDKAVTALTLDLVHGGKSAREAGIDLAALTGLPELANPSPRVETGSRKVVLGIPPGMAWPEKPLCFEINESFLPDGAGGFLKPGAPWTVSITSAEVAEPEHITRLPKPENTPLAKETWHFPKTPATEIFRKETRAALLQTKAAHDITTARETIEKNTRLRNILLRLRLLEKRNLQKAYQERILPIRKKKEAAAARYLTTRDLVETSNIAGTERDRLKKTNARLSDAEERLAFITDDLGDLDETLDGLTSRSNILRQELQQLVAEKAQTQARLAALRQGGPTAERELRKTILEDFPQDVANARWKNDVMTALSGMSGIRTVKTNREGFFRFDNVRQLDGYIMISLPKDQNSTYFWLEPLPDPRIRFIKLDAAKGIIIQSGDFDTLYNYLAKTVQYTPEEKTNP